MKEGIFQCGRVFPSMGGCPSVGGCAPVWEGVSQCRRVCPSVGGCAPVWEDVPQCEREFSSVARNSLCNSPSSFSHTFFLSSFQQVVQVCFMMEERCGYVQDIFDTLKEQEKLFVCF